MNLQKKLKKLNNTNYYFSEYTNLLKKRGIVVLFHNLHPVLIYLKNHEWNKFLKTPNSQGNLFKKLRELKLVVRSPFEDKKELQRAKEKFFNKINTVDTLYLVLITNCNYGCTYCPFSQKNNDHFMSLDTAISGIKLWIRHINERKKQSKKYTLVLYGGEPLLNKEGVYKSISYIRNLEKIKKVPPIQIIVSTNGYFIDDDTISFFKKNNIMVTIGLDGFKKNHNKNRINRNNENTFNKSLKIIKKLVKNKVRVSVSVTITPTNVNQISKMGIFLKKLGIEKFGFNMLRGGGLKLVKNIKKYYIKASDAIIKNLSTQNLNDFEYQASKKYKAFCGKDFFPIDCGCYGNNLVIMPDGTITNCPFAGKRLGMLKKIPSNFRLWDLSYIKTIQKRFPLLDINNHKYYWKSLYGGGCAWNAKKLNNDILSLDIGYNILAKKIFDYFIWKKI